MPVEIRLSKRFLKSAGSLSDVDYGRVEAALIQLQKQWGSPHIYGGLSIRKLHGNYFECRAGLEIRIVFRATDDGLDVVLAGNHDDIRRLFC